MPVVELVVEELDDKVYADVYSSLSRSIRTYVIKVKGTNRMKFIRSAMYEKNF